MIITMAKSLYDKDRYYDNDTKGSRLFPVLNPILYFLDWQKARKFLKRTKLKNGNVLDIGAGDGKFLYFLRKKGLSVFGTTASKISKTTAKYQFDIDLYYTTDIPEELLSRRYEAISYWHVFEHLKHPENHVASWPKLLSLNGTVLIEIPNVESLGSRLNFNAWLGSDLKHHINHMKRDEIASLLSKYRLRIIKEEHFSLKFTYVFLWSALLGAIFGKKYHFDFIFGLLKTPFSSLRITPLPALNSFAAIVYLFPVIMVLAFWGIRTKRGEVLRLWIQNMERSFAPTV